jgi:MAF protein
MKPLILASTSRYRRTLMDRLGMPYEAIAPDFEELPVEGLDPFETVEHFALGKARSLATRCPNALIIGSDQGLIAHGRLWGKPGDRPGAEAQLAALAGGTHTLFTSLVVFDASSGRWEQRSQHCMLHYRALEAAEIADYIARDLPLDCAGSFKIESLGIAIFERVESDDPTGIMGLPLIRLCEALRCFGVSPWGAGS